MLRAGNKTFYGQKYRAIIYFYMIKNRNIILEENPKIIRLNILKNSRMEMKKNLSASLINLGNGVGLIEFHSIIQPQMHPIDGDITGMIFEGIDYLQQRGFAALILGHQGQHFTVGANLALIQKCCEEQNWKFLEKLTKTFQDVNQKIRFSSLPVIAAPFNMCLGGGFEIIGACDRRVASAELYCGLVEFGIGLIPGGGGNLRLLLNNRKAMMKFKPGPFPVVKKTFETIGFAKVSTSAKEAQFLGYLTQEDKIVINPDHLLHEAKQEALSISKNYQPPTMANDIFLPGEGGRLAIQSNLDDLVKAGKISKHDALIGKKLAFVLTGGEKGHLFQAVDEQYLLDIEREAFISLCGESLTQQRIMHMLKTGKPLRN
jgi:3-hydroxyacyl-CoA dehydrogenase